MANSVYRRIKSLHNQALNAKRLCYTPGCENYSINSHVLQKNGVLNHIVENGFLMQVDTDTKEGGVGFKKAGINSTDILAFPGFCNNCDTKLFLPIESKGFDFNNYMHLLLFTYRAIVCELHKADTWLECCDEIINDKWYEADIREMFRHNKIDYTARRSGFINHQFVIGNILFRGTKKWAPTFHVFRIPKQKIVCSAIYCPYMELDDALANRYLNFKPTSYGFPFFHTSIYFHCIPTNDELIVIFGFHKNVHKIEGIPVEDFKFLKDEHVLMLVSTMLIKRVETWGISESLYKDWDRAGLIKLILDTMPYYINNCAENVDLFNLFPSAFIPIGAYNWEDFVDFLKK